MIAVYAETSALVDALFDLDLDARAALEDDGNLLYTSDLTLLEIERRLIRARTESAALERHVRKRLTGLVARLQLLPITPAVLARARQPFLVEPVRTLDAVHLATLLGLLDDLKWCTVLANDRRVRENVDAYGLTLLKSGG